MTDENKPRLVADNPKPKRKAWAKESVRDPEQCVCDVCNGSLWFSAKQSPFYQDFKVIEGVDTMVCVHCFAKGEINTFLGNDYD